MCAKSFRLNKLKKMFRNPFLVVDDEDETLSETTTNNKHSNNMNNLILHNDEEIENSCPSAVRAMMNDSRMDIFINADDDDDEDEDDDTSKSNSQTSGANSTKSNTLHNKENSSRTNNEQNINNNNNLFAGMIGNSNGTPLPAHPPPVYDPNLPSCRVQFATLCKYFEKLSENNKHKEKKAIFDKIFVSCRSDLFQFMRLLLPQLDRERLTYGLKESKIAKYYIEILALPQTCEDALRLKKWKDPSKGTGNSFSDICFQVLQKRGWSSSKNLTVFFINEKLTELSMAGDNDKKKKILLDILKSTSCFEQKWILRIILKDLRIGTQHTTILNHFHPNALELFNSCTDLREVITKCLDPKFKFTTAELRVFSMFKPMLASLLHPAKLAETLSSDEYVIEPKYDGERILVHKKESEIMFFTRNGKDYTSLYGPKFSPIIRNNIKAKVCILDGEFLIWNTELEAFKEFGHNRTHALNDTSDTNEQFCYMVFDLVYLKDKDLSQYPLKKRRTYLENIINLQSHVLELVPQTPVSSEKEVYEQLDIAIMNRDEGIMLKPTGGVYIPGERKWIKLKPDHVDGMGETLDVIIVGGFYGTKFKRKSVSHFLLAVATRSKHSLGNTDALDNLDEENEASNENQVFHSFCKVGSGYTNIELLALQKDLESHWKPFDKTKLPKFYGQWIPGAGEMPDVYIEPKQ